MLSVVVNHQSIQGLSSAALDLLMADLMVLPKGCSTVDYASSTSVQDSDMIGLHSALSETYSLLCLRCALCSLLCP